MTITEPITIIRRYILPSLLLALLLILLFPLTASGEAPGFALAFDGIDDSVALGDTNTLFGGTTWAFQKTISAWVQVEGVVQSTTPASAPLIVGNDGPRTFGISRANYNGLNRIWVWNSDANGVDSVGIEYADGESLEVTLVHDGVTLSAYKNGVFVGSTVSGPTHMPNANSDGNLYIGGTSGSRTTRNLQGTVDEVRMWTVALDEATIAAWSYQEVTAAHPQWANLRAYYKMSDGAGSALTDDSGNGNSGIVTGAAWVASGAFGATPATPTPTTEPTATPTGEPATPTPTPTAEPPTPTPTPTNTPLPPGDAGFALAFDGTTDYVYLAETANILGPGWETSKTVTLWVKPAGVAQCTASSPAHCDAILGDRPRWWGISRGAINGVDRLWVFNYDGNGTEVIGVDYNLDEWLHIAIVHSGGLLQVYRNGVLVGSLPSGATAQPHTGALPVLHLGGIIVNSTRNWSFEGELDEVRFWNYGLSAEQIVQTMNQSLTGTEPGLMAYYAMSDGTGSVLTDDSVNNWNGTLIDGGQIPGNGQLPQWVPSGAFGN